MSSNGVRLTHTVAFRIHVRQPQGNSFNLDNLHGILVIFRLVGVLSTMPVASIPSTRPALL
jgi:hypothetical protein